MGFFIVWGGETRSEGRVGRSFVAVGRFGSQRWLDIPLEPD